MLLPLPIELDGKLYTEAKLKSPTAGSIADAKREADRGESYQAIIEWCAGCVEEFSGVLGETLDIKRAIKNAPFVTALAIALFGRAFMEGDDGLKTTVTCPACGKRRKLERREEDGEVTDTRDHLYELPMKRLENPGLITTKLTRPVVIHLKNRDQEEDYTVREVTMHYPTIGDCVRAARSTMGDDARTQFAIMAESLEAIDGDPVSSSSRATFGRVIFEKMDAMDSYKISEAMNEFGLDPVVTRSCFSCGEEWEEEVNVRSFFDSALRGRMK